VVVVANSVITHESWQGGLNLADDLSDIQMTELTEACDVEISASGGVCTRRPVRPYLKNAPLDTPICSMWQYEIEDGFGARSWLFFQTDDGKVWMSQDDTGVFVPAPFPDNTAVPPTGFLCCYHGWSAGGKLYISNGANVYAWDGVAPAAVPVNTFSVHPAGSEQDITNLGVLGNCDATTYRGIVFLIGGLFASPDIDTLWWSQAIFEQQGNPSVPDGEVAGQEDFYYSYRHTFASGGDGDRVERVVPCGDTLYVFKRHSTYTIQPGPAGTLFAADDLSSTIGMANPKAVVCWEDSVFVFDERKGLYALTNGNFEWLFRQLEPLLACGDIKQTESLALGACDRMILVSVDMVGEGRNTHTFVYDLRTRSWVKWSIGFDCFFNYCPSLKEGACLASVSTPCNTIVRLDHCDMTLTDDFGCATQRFKPQFSTAWFDDDLPYLEKQFKRTEVLVTHTGGVKINTSFAKDWDECTELPGIPIEIEDKFANIQVYNEGVIAAPLVFNNDGVITECPPVEGGPVYGEAVNRGTVARMTPPGKATSVRFSFADCGSNERWCITSLTTFYDPKPVRC